jgi:predicted GIY-YIG superfamily endonuclease
MTKNRPGIRYVYRIYDQHGDLIYVGCTQDLFKRLKAHRLTWWAHQVIKVRAVIYLSPRAGLDEETLAIDTEHPRWNIGGVKWKSNTDWTRQNYIDYMTARINQLQQQRRYGAQRYWMPELARAYRQRFGEDLPQPILSLREQPKESVA